jgi:hypothetical protein
MRDSPGAALADDEAFPVDVHGDSVEPSLGITGMIKALAVI